MTYPQEPQPEKKKSKSGWLIGCAAGAFITLCVVTFLFIGGFAGLIALFGGETAGLRLEVSAPSARVNIGESFTITVTMSNEGTKNILVDSITLPAALTTAAQITDVDPAGVQTIDSDGQTSYDFGLMIAPTGQEKVVFSLIALNSGDISGDINVLIGTKMNPSTIRFVISPETSESESTPEEDLVMGDLIPFRSVVQIIAIIEFDGELVQGWTGSGTIISEDGLILTNAHVVMSDRYYDVVDLVVSITEAQDRPPVPMFYADVLQADEKLDLAVIKVRSDLDGNLANFSALGIEPVRLGSSELLQLGDPIVIMGYPGIGGETITLTRGEVSGFTSEAPYGNRAYIKTSATIAGGNSGGLAATTRGEIIGVPTQVGSGDFEGLIVDCRALADTNRDGFIDELDNCVPTGGFINALRPVQLALPLIDAARAGQVAIITDNEPEVHQEYSPEGELMFSDDFVDNVNGWDVGERTNGWVDITGGQLVIDVYSENYIVWSDLPDDYTSVILAAQAEVINPVGDGDFGFVCGLQDESNFTVLEISEDGYYSIWKYDNDEFISLVEWTYSDTIAAGGLFTMAAYCGPDRLALAVDEVLLTETVDPDYVSGRVGLAVGCFNTPNFRVGFDLFEMYRP